MNSIILIGNICNDVELKVTPAGKSVCSFALAVRRPYAKDTTDFFNIVCWDKQADVTSRYCKKGSQIGVLGILTSRKYKDRDGKDRTVVEVVANTVTFLEKKSDNNATAETPTAPYNNDMQLDEMTTDDDLPF